MLKQVYNYTSPNSNSKDTQWYSSGIASCWNDNMFIHSINKLNQFSWNWKLYHTVANNGRIHFKWKYQEREREIHDFLSIIQLSGIPFQIISCFCEFENVYLPRTSIYRRAILFLILSNFTCHFSYSNGNLPKMFIGRFKCQRFYVKNIQSQSHFIYSTKRCVMNGNLTMMLLLLILHNTIVPVI